MTTLTCLRLLVVLACAPGLAFAAGACDQARVEAAWVRLPPPGMAMTAGYFELDNTGSTTLELNAVSSVDFASAMLHETVLIDGAARMRHVPKVVLAPGAHYSAAPGGAHLMLGEPKVDLATVEHVRFTLHCSDGGTLEVKAALLRDAPGTGSAHHH